LTLLLIAALLPKTASAKAQGPPDKRFETDDQKAGLNISLMLPLAVRDG
jgi:hypothetical protein